jgi:hypothetical protein
MCRPPTFNGLARHRRFGGAAFLPLMYSGDHQLTSLRRSKRLSQCPLAGLSPLALGGYFVPLQGLCFWLSVDARNIETILALSIAVKTSHESFRGGLAAFPRRISHRVGANGKAALPNCWMNQPGMAADHAVTPFCST